MTGKRAHVNATQVLETAFQAHERVVDPDSGVLLHSEAFNNNPHDSGFDLHYVAKSHPKVDL